MPSKPLGTDPQLLARIERLTGASASHSTGYTPAARLVITLADGKILAMNLILSLSIVH
jgi:hypothetical protein